MGRRMRPTHSRDKEGWVSTNPSILETSHSAVTPTIAASRAMTIYQSVTIPMPRKRFKVVRGTYNSGQNTHLRQLFLIFLILALSSNNGSLSLSIFTRGFDGSVP
jgi:hypothetical protein